MIAEFLILLLCLTLQPLVMIGYGRLRIEEDYFFMIFLILGVLYIIAAPALVYIGGDVAFFDGGESYPKIQALILIFFLFPLGLTYRLLKNKICSVDFARPEYYLSESKVVLFCLFFLAFEIVFTLLALKSNMYARRIGTEVIAEVVGGLDMFSLAVLRTHDLIVLPVITFLAILMPSIKRQTKTWVYILAYLTLGMIVCSFVVFAAINSRALLVFLAMALIFANLLSSNAKIKLSGRVLLLGLVAVLYSLIVVSNVRNHGAEAGVSDILNPISFITETDSEAFNKWEWTQRLDCVDMIAKMDESQQRNGYEWGNAWTRPLVTMFGQLIGSDRAAEYKAKAITTAKTYLMEKHTDIDTKDYPSCMVTDLWGNFWIYGLPVAAILISICFVLLRYGLTASVSPAALVISLVFAFYWVVFEKEFVDWLFGWVKLVPAIILLVLLNPIQRISVRNYGSHSGISS